jgi:hypothetical protein
MLLGNHRTDTATNIQPPRAHGLSVLAAGWMATGTSVGMEQADGIEDDVAWLLAVQAKGA